MASVGRIVAIDPGSAESAWCLLEGDKPIAFAKEPNAAVLARVRGDFASHDLLACEGIASYGMAVGKEVFDTCILIGRFQEAWEARGGAFKLVYRRDVKLHHCGSARATDSNIRAALLDRYGPGRPRAIGTKREPGPLYGLKGDCWAALAVALTAGSAGPLFATPAPAPYERADGMPF